jgi:putative methionine-R-sulfoxide reductase with GAF domain
MKLSDPDQYIRKLKAVLEVTKAYRNIIHLDVLLSTIVETAADTVGAEAGSILLYDDDGRLRFHTASGDAARAVKPMAVEPGQGIAGWTADTGKPAIVNDVDADPRFEGSFDQETGFRTRSILCVPLTLEDKVIGVIELLNKNGDGEFDDEDQSLLFSLADQAAISIEHVRLMDARNNYFTHVSEILIGVMDTHVPIKSGHARRVARYSRLVGARLGLPEGEQRTLYFAGLLHDVGLLKLDATKEWTRERIELHPILGYEMLKDIIFWKDLAPLILHHHERWDGRGYPDKLEGNAIPQGARVIGVCEAFDVITSKNSYKSPLPYDMAIRELEAHAGTQFDPEIVEALKNSVSEEDTLEKKKTPRPDTDS